MRARITNAWLALLLVFLAALLLFLAALQYRWIGEVSAADEQRMKANIEFASRQFADELDGELARAFSSYQGMPNADELPHRYEEWASTTRDIQLLRSLYVVEDGAIHRFDPETQSLVNAPWPPELEPARHIGQPPRLSTLLRDIPAFVIPMPHRPLGLPPPPIGEGRPPQGRPRPPLGQQRPPLGQRGLGGFGDAPPPREWQDGPPPRADRPRRPPSGPSLLIIELERGFIMRSLVPEIARHAFRIARHGNSSCADTKEHPRPS